MFTATQMCALFCSSFDYFLQEDVAKEITLFDSESQSSIDVINKFISLNGKQL